ncbi:MAG: SWIM zinc finger family protein [Acidobacteria bacterium]|nr:SWIM zinc finger family protein [Acidobacteriota bacterium]
MIENLRYAAASGLVQRAGHSELGLATNTLRGNVYFSGLLRQPLPLREALGALRGVVVSDLKFRPKDRPKFQAWLEEEDRRFLATLGIKSEHARQELERLNVSLDALNRIREKRREAFHAARLAYFRFVLENEYEKFYILDPVITVHPDEVFFEAFSRDESSYARLGVSQDLFDDVGPFACGTTNIDFSASLAEGFDRLRAYRDTRFAIGPSGFAVATNTTTATNEDSEVHHEKKVDLPESWVRGFLQVQSAMSLSMPRFSLAPVDLYNICRFLKSHRTRKSPRALRWELEPGKRVRAVLEPWGHVIELSTIYDGTKAQSIRTWGRDRLKVLARLLPVAQRIDVHLAGTGLPSFYVLDLGGISFTLALSGWTDNDWTGGAKFDLLTRRLTGTAAEVLTVYEALRLRRFATDAELAEVTGFGIEKCRTTLSYLCQAGRAIYDLGKRVYRHRDLFFDPFTLQDAAAAVKPALEEKAPEAKAAKHIHEAEDVRVIARRPVTTGYKLSGSARGASGPRVRPLLHVDYEGQIIEASCTCAHFRSHGLTQGPCEHVLALRLAHMERLAKEDSKGGLAPA